MFDLNEIPEQPLLRLEAEDHETAPASVDGVTKSEISGNVCHASADSDRVKGQAYGEGASVASEIAPETRDPKPSLSFEPLATKRQYGSDSKASLLRRLSFSYREDEDEEEEAAAAGGFTSNLLQRRQQQQRLQQQGQRASPRDEIQERDLLISTRGVAYRFMGGGADASTSRKHEDLLDEPPVDDRQTPTILSLKRAREPQMDQLKDAGGQASAEGSAFGLSLGSGFHGSQPRDLRRCSSKKPNLFGLALGRTDDGPLTSRKSSDLSPFWRGKLRTDVPLLTPVVAYCLGIMKPDSRLKKLPSVLSSRKLVKLEEFQKILCSGVAEPLTQFKPSLEASMEEVKRFNLMVEALSHGSGLLQSSSVLGGESGQQSLSADATFPYSAALISWEEDADYSLDAKLYLVSSPIFQVVLKKCQSNMSLGALEEIDVLDPESLYGIFCRSSSSNVNDNLDPFQTGDQDVGRSIAVSINEGPDATSSATAAFAEKAKDMVATNSTTVTMASPSRNKHHVARSEILTKSAPMESNRVSCRDNSRFDFEEAGRGSKKRYQRQLSSIDMIHEAGGKHHSKYSNGTNDLYEEDSGLLNHQQVQSKHKEKFSWNYGRHSQRQEWRSDRSKDTSRWSKEDRDSGKNRVKEHQRHSHHESERGWKPKTMEKQHRNQDKAWLKEKEKSSKDDIAEDLKTKFVSEKSLAGSKSNSSLLHRVSPDHESGKLNKKRDREDEKESIVHMKRLRELEVTALLESDQLVRDTNDLKCKLEIEPVNQEDCLPQKEPGQVERLSFTEPNIESYHLDEGMAKPQLSHESFDGILGVKNTESHCLDDGMAKPLLTHGSFDGTHGSFEGVEHEVNGVPISETEGVIEMDMGFNLLTSSAERIRVMENGVSLKWDETLGDSPLDKVGKEEEKEETRLEFFLDGFDKETRTWLMSKQNALYLQQEYGVDAIINSDVSNLNSGLKTDSQNGPLQVRIAMTTSESCDAAEAKWFVDQAAGMVKSIASRGVYIKCLWYEGPVQIHPGDGAPVVPVIVKKIKGEDGKNLERMQDATGVMIGVVLRKGGVAAPHEAESMSRPRFIGLRLKCIRRKGLLEASKEAEALLECVAEHFSKALATHIADLQESALHHSESVSNQDSPSTHAISTKELSNSPVKAEGQTGDGSSGSPKLDEATPAASLDEINAKVSNKTLLPKEEPEVDLPSEPKEVVSRPLYVSNLPEHITPIKIRNIFENVLKEKLESSGGFESDSDLVADVRYIADKFCAFVELANDDLLNASLKLYAEDKTVFHGLSVELGLQPIIKTERQSSFSSGGARNRGINSGEHSRTSLLARNKEDDYERRQYGSESDSDYSYYLWYAENVASRTDYFLDKPRPLFLSELMRNASALTIKQLFEDIITTYIGPSLVSSSGRQLVLDVRYVPSRGCAFVDLATPELVEFMLDLHSRRPEVFLNMKVELGRRPVPYSVEDDADRRLNMRSRDVMHGKSQYGSQSCGYRLNSSASRKNTEKRPNGSYNDYLEDSDKGDDFSRQSGRLRKLQRSDPEKTIYADRLPESASEGMIRKIFERVLLQNLTPGELDVFGEHMITEVRHVPTKYCAFVVFATEDLTRTVLHLYNQDEDAFECMRLKPHFHSRMEDLYKEDVQEIDEVVHPTASFRDRVVNLDIDEYVRPRKIDLFDSRNRSAAHRAVTASAFKEVDRRRSVYVDKIPEDLSELAMTEMFEKVFRHKKHGYDGHMVSQVAYFRDKFDPSKLCAFVEVKTEDGTQDLVDFYNANQDAFQGMRVRPGFKYNT